MRQLKILFGLILVVALTSTVYGAWPYSMTYTPSTGDTILPEHISTSNTEHINSNIPESIDDFSSNASEMQLTTDPYPAGVVSLSATLDGELQRLRYVIAQITQEAQWYIDPPIFCENSADYDHGTGDLTTGGKIVFDVAGSGISSVGSINFGTDTAAIWSDGTDLFGTSTADISWNAAGNDHIFQSVAVTQATIDDTGIDIITGNEYMINATSVLSGTTLGSGVVNSSLTSLGSLTALKVDNAVMILEQAAANVDEATYGQLWVKSTTPCELWFTDDVGTDTQLTGGGSSANITLSNLGSTAINAALISDTDITDDLGTGDIRWKDGWLETLSSGLTATDTLKLRGYDVDGAAYVDIITITSNNTVTADLWASTTIGSAEIITPASTSTFTNKTFDANGTGNSLSNVDAADISSWTSAELATILSDETGTNTAVFSDDATLTRPIFVDIVDPSSKVSTVAAAGATETLDYTVAQVFDITLDQACTLTFSNPPASGSEGSFVLYLRQEATGGGNAVTWPASVDWPSATAPTLTTGVNDLSILIFSTLDGGTTWHGMLGSGDSS